MYVGFDTECYLTVLYRSQKYHRVDEEETSTKVRRRRRAKRRQAFGSLTRRRELWTGHGNISPNRLTCDVAALQPCFWNSRWTFFLQNSTRENVGGKGCVCLGKSINPWRKNSSKRNILLPNRLLLLTVRSVPLPLLFLKHWTIGFDFFVLLRITE